MKKTKKEKLQLSNDNFIEKNELNKNAKGGTELMQERLANSVSPDLLKNTQIIASRSRILIPNMKHVFWLHDLHADPEVRHLINPEERDKYNMLVFVSNWQMQQYNTFLGVPYNKSVVIENGIIPIEENKKFDDAIHIVYTPTPHRGLEILIPVFDVLSKKYSNIVLDVFSSFKLYGWEERDEPYKELFEKCKQHSKINYYGTVSNEEIRNHISKCHIFAYPSIWQETSCLTLIEAMSAKCLSIHPNYAALPDTSGSLNLMYQYQEDLNVHANHFAQILESAIKIMQDDKMSNYISDKLNFIKTYTDFRFNWENKKQQWEALLQSLD